MSNKKNNIISLIFHSTNKYSAYFGEVECQQTSFASTDKNFKSTVCEKIPLFMKLTNLLMW